MPSLQSRKRTMTSDDSWSMTGNKPRCRRQLFCRESWSCHKMQCWLKAGWSE